MLETCVGQIPSGNALCTMLGFFRGSCVPWLGIFRGAVNVKNHERQDDSDWLAGEQGGQNRKIHSFRGFADSVKLEAPTHPVIHLVPCGSCKIGALEWY